MMKVAKRIASWFLVLLMAFTILPTDLLTIFAAQAAQTPAAAAEQAGGAVTTPNPAMWPESGYGWSWRGGNVGATTDYGYPDIVWNFENNKLPYSETGGQPNLYGFPFGTQKVYDVNGNLTAERVVYLLPTREGTAGTWPSGGNGNDLDGGTAYYYSQYYWILSTERPSAVNTNDAWRFPTNLSLETQQGGGTASPSGSYEQYFYGKADTVPQTTTAPGAFTIVMKPRYGFALYNTFAQTGVSVQAAGEGEGAKLWEAYTPIDRDSFKNSNDAQQNYNVDRVLTAGTVSDYKKTNYTLRVYLGESVKINYHSNENGQSDEHAVWTEGVAAGQQYYVKTNCGYHALNADGSRFDTIYSNSGPYFRKAGYTFLGWTLDKRDYNAATDKLYCSDNLLDLERDILAASMMGKANEHHLYAQWEKTETLDIVKVDSESGEDIQNNPVTFTVSAFNNTTNTAYTNETLLALLGEVLVGGTAELGQDENGAAAVKVTSGADGHLAFVPPADLQTQGQGDKPQEIQFTLSELVAPEGYEKVEGNFVFTLDSRGNIKYVEAQSSLQDIDGNNVSVKTQEKDGKIVRIELPNKKEPAGRFILTKIEEKETPDAPETIIKGEEKSAGFVLSYQNQDGTTLYVKASQPDEGQAVYAFEEGVEIYADATVLFTGEGSGKLEITGLPLGKYQYKEVEFPQGYAADPNKTGTFEIERIAASAAASLAQAKDAEAKVENKPQLGVVELLKTDAEAQKPLAGAEFTLYEKKADGSQGKEVAHVVTGADGKIVFEDIAIGEYLLVETKAPAGYTEKTGAYTVIVAADPEHGEAALVTVNGAETVSGQEYAVIRNTPDPVKVTLHKLWKNAKGETGVLSGAAFEVRDESGALVYQNLITGQNGEAVFEILIGKTYTVTEVSAPAGYNKTEKTYQLRLAADGKTVEWKDGNGWNALAGNALTVENPLATAQLTLKKHDRGNDMLLGGVTFTVSGGKYQNEKFMTGTSTGVTPAITGLEYNVVYTVTEDVPAGYTAKVKTFYLRPETAEGVEGLVVKLYSDAGCTKPLTGADVVLHSGEITVENDPVTAQVKIKKVDEKGQPLSGAGFKVDGVSLTESKDKDGNVWFVLPQLTYKAGGKVYTIYETAPQGYTGAGEFYLKAQADGSVVLCNADGSTPAALTDVEIKKENGVFVVTVLNKAGETKSFIEKTDSESGKRMAVAFDWTAVNTVSGRQVDSGTFTTKADTAEGFNFVMGRTYTFIEKAVPGGYANQPVVFTVTANPDGTLTVGGGACIDGYNVIKAQNSPKTLSAVLNKVDEKGNALSGAKFTITQDAAPVLRDAPAGSVSFNVIFGKVYTVTETAAPAGYNGLKATVKFQLVYNESNKKLEIDWMGTNTDGAVTAQIDQSETSITLQAANTPIQGMVQISKTDEADIEIPGVGYRIYRSDNELTAAQYADEAALSGAAEKLVNTETGDIFITNQDGKIIIDPASYGWYYAVEVSAPYVYNRTMQPQYVGAVTENSGQSGGKVERDFTNSLTKGKIELTKTGSNGAKLSGAVFEIYKGAEGAAFADAEKIGELTTGTNGIGTLENLGAGQYWAKEITPPAGYELPAEGNRVTYLGEVRFGSELTGLDGVVTLKATVSNELLNAKLFVKKVDENGNVLAAEENPFRVEASDGSTVGMIKEGDGLWSFNAIHGVDYTITEPNPPRGYDAAQGSAVVTLQDVKENGIRRISADKAFTVDEKGLTVTVADNKIKADLKLTKYGDKTLNQADGESLLNGVVFALYKENPQANPEATVIATVTTGKTYDGLGGAQTNGSTGVALIKNVEYGTYYAKEVSAPEAYQVNADTVYTLTVSETGTAAEQIVHDRRVGASIVVEKQDAAGNKLEGTNARFTIYQVRQTEDSLFQNIADWFASLSGNEFDEKMTAVATNVKAGDSVAVGAGTYIAVETTAPDGYTLNSLPSEPVKVSQGDHGKIFTSIIQNEKQTAQVTVQKTDGDWKALNGASVIVTGSDGSSVNMPVNGNTFTFNAVWGVVYTVNETAAPAGYNGLPASENGFTFTLSHDGTKIVAQSKNAAKAAEEIAFKGSENVRLNGALTLQVRNNPILGSIELAKTGEKQTENGLVQKPLADVYYAVYKDAQGIDKLEGPETVSGVSGLWKTNGNGIITIENVPYGSYYAQEISAPAGYNVDPAIREIGNIRATGDKIAVSYQNTLIRGSVELTKTDVDTGAALAGVTFELWRRHDVNNVWDALFGQDVKIDTQKTDENGKIIFTGVPAGSYYVVEKDVPAGYDPAAVNVKTEVQGVIIADNDTLSVAVTNEKIKADLVLTKTGDGGQKLAGVTFQLYHAGDNTPVGAPVTTGGDGTATWKNLEVGNYYVIETAAPDAYVLPEGGIRYPEGSGVWTVEDGRSGKQILSQTVSNQLVKGSIGILKVAEDKVTPLAGAEFELYRKDNAVYTKVKDAAVTGADGQLLFTDLGVGEYYVKETKAPDGYNKLEGYIAVGTISRENPSISAQKNKIENSKVLASLQLHKVGGVENGVMTSLAGVRFQLYDNMGNAVFGEVTTGADGIAEWNNIPVGSYYALETYAPDAYYLSAEQKAKRYEFTVTAGDNGKTLAYGEDVKNYLVNGAIEIVKKDSATKETIDGAVFTLWQVGVNGAADKSYGQKTTAGGGKARWENLPYGNYYVVEDSAPYGYIPLTARIDINGTLNRDNDSLTQEIGNDKLHANLVVNKADENGNPLADVTFQLYKKNADGAFEAVTGATAATGSAGAAIFENLEAGFYYVKEIAAPGRFKLDSEKAWPSETGVEIKANGQNVAVNVTNELVPVTVIVDKYEDGNALIKLAGAQFTLYGKDSSGNFTVVKGSGETDENGMLTFNSGLYAGETYLLKETAAPYGYAITGEGTYTITPQRDGTNAVTVTQQVANRRVLGTATIHKVGADGALEGVTFELIRTYLKGGVSIIENMGGQTTDAGGSITWTNLPVGTYKAVETGAPDAYQLPDEKPIYTLGEISEGNTSLTAYTGENAIRNQPVQGSITLTKVDAENTQLTLAGAVFKLQKMDANGHYADVPGSEQTTGANGVAQWTGLGVGSYKTVEVSAPYGYQLTADSEKEFIVARDGDNAVSLTATITNQLIRGSVELKKVGAGADKDGLAGVTLQLYRTYNQNGTRIEMEPVSAQTTNATGVLRWEGLGVGAYYVKEISAPAGYAFNPESVYSLGTITQDNRELTSYTGENAIVNTPVMGNVTLTKTNEENKTLAGATFTLYKGTYPGGVEQLAITTKADGIAAFTGLAYGHYYILETKAPYGYDPIKGIVWEGTIEQSKADPTQNFEASLTVPNGVIYGSAKLKKTGEEADKDSLAGVGFDLYRTDGATATVVGETRYTDNDGVIEWTNLPVGSYYALEVSAPDNYVLPEGDAARIELGEIKAQGDVLDGRYTLAVKNALVKGEITIVKYDNETAEDKGGVVTVKDGQSIRYLDGAAFTLYRREKTGDVAVDSGVTANGGKLTFKDLPVGDYYLKETQPPAGYQPIEGVIEIGVKGQHDITRGVTALTAAVGNSRIYGSAELLKTDAAGNPLAGVTFELYRNGTRVENSAQTTGADGKLRWDNLAVGSYTVVETAAPDAYQLPNTKPEYSLGEITRHGQVLALTGEQAITNKPVQGSIAITKVDASNHNIKLAGAAFQLYKENAGVYELYGQPVETDTNGVAKWDGLGVGNYKAVEVAAPYGYTINTQEQLFTIARDGVKDIALTAMVENSKFHGTASLKKTGENEDADGLQGVTFQLWRTYENAAGTSVTEAVGGEKTTNAEGIIMWDALEVGDYYVTETSAPLNYRQPDTSRQYILGAITKEGDTANLCLETPITNKLVKGSITINKTDIESGAPLAGAAFDLYRRGTSGVVAQGVTDSEGQITFGGLVTGDYYLKETKAPAGYELITGEIEIGVKGQDDITRTQLTAKATVENQKIYGSAEIEKQGEDKTPLAGVTFELHRVYDGKDIVVGSKTTGADGKAVWSLATGDRLEIGEYYVIETKAPENYILPEGDAAKHTLGTIAKQGDALALTGSAAVKNTLVRGQITIVKYDGATQGENKKYLDGAEFALYRQEAEGDVWVATKATGADGKAVFENLITGTYYVKETAAPEGYDPILTDIEAGTLTRETTAITKEIPNGVIYGSIVLTKTGDNGALLEGASFRLYRKGTGENGADEALTTVQTNAAGTARWDTLPVGSYYVKEVAVDGAYLLDANKVWDAGEIVSQGQILEISAENVLVKGSVALHKTDAEDNAALAGAEFDLYRREGVSSVKVNRDALVTDDNGNITVQDLPVGDYYFVETKAPAGYELPAGDKAIFEVGGTGSNDITRESPNPAVVQAANAKIYGKAILHKTGDANETDKAGLAGVVFQLYDAEGNTVQAAQTTDEHGNITWSRLPVGVYYAQEVSAPENYQLDTETKYWFTEITAQGQVVQTGAENQQVLGSITLKKIGASDEETLGGAEFALYRRVNGGAPVWMGTSTTGNTGTVTFTNLPVGDYYAEEKTAPAGYEPITGIIEIGKVNGNDITRSVRSVSETVKNNKIYGSAKLIKTGDGGALLENVEFQLYDNSGAAVQDVKRTDANGEIRWTGLPVGRYYAKEVSAPGNYELDTQTAHWFDAIQTQGQTVEITVSNTLVKGSIKVIKIDGATKKPLAGAEFDLYRTGTAEAIAHGITNAAGEILFEDLVAGQYYLRETKAPMSYARIEGDIQVGDITRSVTALTKEVPNGVIYGSAEIHKTGADGPLAGVTFQLYRKGENGAADMPLTTAVTDSDGIARWDMLTIGAYYAKETAAPDEYKLDTETIYELGTIESTVTDQMQKQVLSIDVTNQLVSEGIITLRKTDAENGIPLDGAEFDLYRRTGTGSVKMNAQPLVTDKNGEIRVENLPVGDYYFVETKAPDGYELPAGNAAVFEVGSAGSNDITRDRLTAPAVNAANNKIYGSVEVEKKGDGGMPLAGVTFELHRVYKGADTTVGSKITDINGKVVWSLETQDRLEIGEYYVVETAAPESYVLPQGEAAKHTLGTIAKQGDKLELTGARAVTNELVQGVITVVKYDAAAEGEPLYLAEAEFDLYREGTADPVAHGSTGADGRLVFSGLPIGSYYLVETKAPDGYILDSTPLQVGVISRGSVAITKEIPNHKLHGSVQVTKTDAENSAKTLGGAVFGIYTTPQAAAAKDETYLATAITDAASGVAVFANLEKGVYYIAEITAPYGYQVDGGVYTAQISANEQVVSLNVSDELIRGNIQLLKTGKDGVPLDGAVFEIYDAAGKVWATVTTANGGSAQVENLPVGEYWARETAAPEHYELLSAPVALGSIAVHGQTLTPTVSNAKIQHQITTEVINGTTTTPQVMVDDGENGQTVFQPADENYLLRQVVIQKLNTDGTVAEETVYVTPEQLAEFQDGEKTFENVTQDWHVIVTYERQYRVTYHGNGNTAGTAPIDAASPYWAGSKTNNAMAQGDLAKQNYTFLGWAESEEAANAANPVIRYPVGAAITGNIQRDYDLWAVWGVDGQYDVLYTPGTGEGEAFSQGFRFEGDSYTVLDNVSGDASTPSFTKEHYHFIGWTTDESAVTANVGDTCKQPARQVVYVAQWEKDETYTLTYHANNETIGGAGGEYADPTAYYLKDQWITLPVTDGNMNYTTPGYKFYGWNTQADGSGKFYTPGSVGVIEGETHLYAMWTTGPVALTPEAAIMAEHHYYLDNTNPEGQLVQPDLRGIVTIGNNPLAALIANIYGENVYQLTGTIRVERTPIPRTVEEPVYENIGAAFPSYQKDLDALKAAQKALETAKKAEQDAKLALEGSDKTALLAEAEQKAADAQSREDTLTAEIAALTQALADAGGIDTANAEQALEEAKNAAISAQEKLTEQDTLVAEKQQAYNDAQNALAANTDETQTEALKAAVEEANTLVQTEIGNRNVLAEELRVATEKQTAAQQALDDLLAKKDSAFIQQQLDAKNAELSTVQQENITAQQELKALQDFVNDPANATNKDTAQKNYDAAKQALDNAQKAYDEAKAKVDAIEQSTAYQDMVAKNEKLKTEYDALVAKTAAEDAKMKAETVELNADGTLTVEEGYAYKLIFIYNRETPITPPPTPIPPPEPTPPPVPTIPLPPDPVPLAPPPVPTFYTLAEDPVPHGSLPRRSGLYTLADDDVPLGKLPKTSGNRGTAAGSAGVLALLAGAVLGLFGKKKKKDEE